MLPETLYYQIDGGSENTARAVYFLCELIVARRLVKCIKLSRLMVGHTHCDIDAAFAKIWTHARVILAFIIFLCQFSLLTRIATLTLRKNIIELLSDRLKMKWRLKTFLSFPIIKTC